MSSSGSWNPFLSTAVILSPQRRKMTTPLFHLIASSNSKPKPNNNNKKLIAKPPHFECRLGSLLFQCGVLFTSVETPAALAVTGENGGDDLMTTVVSGGIVAVLYLFVIPPILMNWMRLRWYKRKFLEMYLQFMCVFIFFPGLLLWAPFVNFRKFPRDPTMEYPWSTPKDDVPLYKSR